MVLNTLLFKIISFWTLLLIYVTLTRCWEYFRRAQDYEPIRTLDLPHYQGNITFGECLKLDRKILFEVYEPAERMAGTMFMRNWLNVVRTPSCVIMFPHEAEELTEEYHLPTFQVMMCIARVDYCHGQKRFMYHYYEWFYPVEWVVTSWNLSFYSYNTTEFTDEPWLVTTTQEPPTTTGKGGFLFGIFGGYG